MNSNSIISDPDWRSRLLDRCGLNSPTNRFTMVTAEGTQVEGVMMYTEYVSALPFVPTWVSLPPPFSRTVAMNVSKFEPEGTGSNLQLVMSRMLK
jgi:hypothetical protein